MFNLVLAPPITAAVGLVSMLIQEKPAPALLMVDQHTMNLPEQGVGFLGKKRGLRTGDSGLPGPKRGVRGQRAESQMSTQKPGTLLVFGAFLCLISFKFSFGICYSLQNRPFWYSISYREAFFQFPVYKN